MPEQQRLLKLLDLHPMNEIAKLMRRPKSSIWHMLYRLNANAKMAKDSFTKYTLALALHVETRRIEEWIARGWLKSQEVECGQTKRTFIRLESVALPYLLEDRHKDICRRLPFCAGKGGSYEATLLPFSERNLFNDMAAPERTRRIAM